MNASKRDVVIREVGLRDGLQSISRTLATEHKLEGPRDAHTAGLREIEIGSFVPARLLPRPADTADLVAVAKTLPGLVLLHGALRRAGLPKTMRQAA
jgi:hydroxymethylglutaryl-CoA lyase